MSLEMKNNFREKNLGLDMAKIFACVMVVIMHTLRVMEQNVSYHPVLYYFTRCAVPLFFMAGGFIQLNKETVTFSYCVKKIRGILIVGFSWTALYSLVKIILKRELMFPHDMYMWLIGKGMYSIFWFLVTMGLIYVILVPLRKVYSSRAGVWLFVGLVVLCVIIDTYNFINICYLGNEYFVQEPIPQALRMWSWVMYFFAGGIIGKYKIYDKIKLVPMIFINVVLAGAAIWHMYYVLKVSTNIVNGGNMYESLLLIIWSLSMFCLFLRIRWHKIKNFSSVLSVIRPVLIPVYACHVVIINFLNNISYFSTYYGQIVCIIFVLCICFVIGIILGKIPVLRRICRI